MHVRAWGRSGEHVATGPLSQALCVSPPHTYTTQRHTNPQNSDLHSQTQSFPHMLRPTRWKDPPPTPVPEPALLCGCTETLTASQPAQQHTLNTCRHAINTFGQRHTHSPPPLTQIHVTEGHATRRLSMQHRDEQPSEAQPQNAEAHTTLTGTHNRTGHVFNTDRYTCNAPRHTHNKQKDPHHMDRYTHF